MIVTNAISNFIKDLICLEALPKDLYLLVTTMLTREERESK